MPKEDTQYSATYQPAKRGHIKKGQKHFKTLIREVLAQKAEKSGELWTRDLLMVDAMVEKAIKGDVSAFNSICNRLEGMPKQEVDLNNKIKVSRIKKSFDGE